MKKFKKILSLATTTIIAMTSLSAINRVNAIGRGSHRIYFDVPANSSVAYASIDLISNTNEASLLRSNTGNLGGFFGFSYSNGGANIHCYYESNNFNELTSPGTIGVVVMGAYVDVDNIFDVVDLNINAIVNGSFDSLPTSRIRISSVLIGDVNQDGYVNNNDLNLLTKYYNGQASLSGNALRAADTNGDFVVSIDDISCLEDHINNGGWFNQ